MTAISCRLQRTLVFGQLHLSASYALHNPGGAPRFAPRPRGRRHSPPPAPRTRIPPRERWGDETEKGAVRPTRWGTARRGIHAGPGSGYRPSRAAGSGGSSRMSSFPLSAMMRSCSRRQSSAVAQAPRAAGAKARTATHASSVSRSSAASRASASVRCASTGAAEGPHRRRVPLDAPRACGGGSGGRRDARRRRYSSAANNASSAPPARRWRPPRSSTAFFRPAGGGGIGRIRKCGPPERRLTPKVFKACAVPCTESRHKSVI